MNYIFILRTVILDVSHFNGFRMSGVIKDLLLRLRAFIETYRYAHDVMRNEDNRKLTGRSTTAHCTKLFRLFRCICAL